MGESASSGPVGAPRHRGRGDPAALPPTAPHLDCGCSGGTRRSGRQAGPGACASLRSGRPRGHGAGPVGLCPPPCSALRGIRVSLWPRPCPPSPHPACCPGPAAPTPHPELSLWCGQCGDPRRHGLWRWPGASRGPGSRWRSHRPSPQMSSGQGPSRVRAAQPGRPAPCCRGSRCGGPRRAAGGRWCQWAGGLAMPLPTWEPGSLGTWRQRPAGGGGWPRPGASGCPGCQTVTTDASLPLLPVSSPGAVSLEGRWHWRPPDPSS